MNIKPWVLNLLGLLLILFLGISVASKVYDFSKDLKKAPDKTMSMSAEGKVTAKPDLATVSVGVTTQAATAKAAQEENTKSTNKVIEFIKKQGITDDDIVTSNFSVYPSYDYSGGKSTINGYNANQTLTIKVHNVDKSTATLNTILGGAFESGSNQLQGVFFSFDDPDNYRQEARRLAIEKAKQKAADLASASGLKLGKVVSISESSSGGIPYPASYELGAGRGGGGASPDIQTGSQDITATMTLVFELK